MKAALLALDQLNALAWQQSLQEGDWSILSHDKLKNNALDELQNSLSMPDQISSDLARPLLASAVDEVRLISHNRVVIRLHRPHVCEHDFSQYKRGQKQHARQLALCMLYPVCLCTGAAACLTTHASLAGCLLQHSSHWLRL